MALWAWMGNPRDRPSAIGANAHELEALTTTCLLRIITLIPQRPDSLPAPRQRVCRWSPGSPRCYEGCSRLRTPNPARPQSLIGARRRPSPRPGPPRRLSRCVRQGTSCGAGRTIGREVGDLRWGCLGAGDLRPRVARPRDELPGRLRGRSGWQRVNVEYARLVMDDPAKQALSDLIFGKVATVREQTRDRYGRTVGRS